MRPTAPIVHRLILKAEFFVAIEKSQRRHFGFRPATYFLAKTISIFSEFDSLGLFALGMYWITGGGAIFFVFIYFPFIKHGKTVSMLVNLT